MSFDVACLAFSSPEFGIKVTFQVFTPLAVAESGGAAREIFARRMFQEGAFERY